jgi:hypothetical protein
MNSWRHQSSVFTMTLATSLIPVRPPRIVFETSRIVFPTARITFRTSLIAFRRPLIAIRT